MSSAGGRPSRQKMVSVGTSIVPPGPRPSPADTPGPSTAATTPQATASLHDFAVSLERQEGARLVTHVFVPYIGAISKATPLNPANPANRRSERVRSLPANPAANPAASPSNPAQPRQTPHTLVGVPPTFRTADPLGSLTGKDRNNGGKVQEILTGVPGRGSPDGGRDLACYCRCGTGTRDQ